MPLLLGDFLFDDWEIPAQITGLGGHQSLAKHKLIGGQRVVDAMGADDGDPSWSGRFQGADATSRAQQLDAMRQEGAELTLSFGAFFYTVVIEEFTFEFERDYQIIYHIKVFVISSDPGDVSPSLGELIISDLALLTSAISAFSQAF